MRSLPAGLLERLRSGGKDLTLVVLRTGALGDILRTLPAVRWVRSSVPECRLVWIADERWTPILEGHRDLDRVLGLPRSLWKRAARSPRSFGTLIRSVREFAGTLRGEKADVALDFHGNLRSGVLGVACGAPVRLGYEGHEQKEGNRWFSTHRVLSGPRRSSRIERNLSLVRALGLPDAPLPDGGLDIGPVPLRLAAEALTQSGCAHEPYAVVAPGASRGQAYKKPPTALLAEAARALERLGIVPLVVHGPGEIADAQAVVREAAGKARIAPPTDLLVLAALMRGARMFVGGDTGPLHLACAVGSPVVGIYGPTDPVVNSPWGVPHVVLAPAGRIYTGIKRLDRASGGFSGLEAGRVAAAIEACARIDRRIVAGS